MPARAGVLCSNECCPGMPDGRMYCLTTAIGVDRCFVTGQCKAEGVQCNNPADCCSGVCEGGVCGGLVCIGDGQSCAFSDQCCSGICAPDPTTGQLVCNPDCIPNGQACTAEGDCCAGYCDIQTLTCGYVVVN